VLLAKQLRANGIVFGILEEDGEIDTTRTRCLIEIARPLKVTFHRAFDMSRDLNKSLHDVIESGADRVLTSGGEQSVEDGVPAIADLMRRAAGKIAIMIGGGITPANVRAIIEATGVHEIHASVRVHVPSPMRHRNEKISMGMAQGREYQRVMVFEDEVRRLAESANHGSQHRAKVH
jgi:copper homeostasis protein